MRKSASIASRRTELSIAFASPWRALVQWLVAMAVPAYAATKPVPRCGGCSRRG